MKRLSTGLLLVLATAVQAQSLESNLTRFANQYATEKLYLHYDKSSYLPGETVWFKAYAMEGLFPAAASKTLYVDYIADNGTVLSHVVSPLIEGATNGQFEIPSDYNGNWLHVRAYTKWMLNFDTAFLYAHDIRILQKPVPGARPAKLTVVPRLDFFPEGGDAIAGLPGKVAFKVTDQWGNPQKLRGVVMSDKGVVVDSLRVLHDGMGFFTLTPDEGASYTAKWRDEKGAMHTTALPAVKPSGASMQVTVNGTKRIVVINSNAEGEVNGLLHLVGTINQRLVFQNDVTPVAGGVRRVIPTENVSSGVLVLTLFDRNWKPLAERISFLNNNDYSFPASMEVEHWGLGKRKRNEIRISVPDSLQGASLSVSVTDASIDRDTAENILSGLMLSSELRGKVYHPAYYFADNSDARAQELDLVMLTNGWRRYAWSEIVQGKFAPLTYARDTSYLALSGKLFGVSNSMLSGKENIVLLVKEKDSATKMVILPVNRDASFGDPDIVIFDTVQIYYSLKSKLLTQAEARFLPDRLPAPNYSVFSKGFITDQLLSDTSGNRHHLNLAGEENRLRDAERGKMMELVTVRAKQKSTVQQMDERYASGLFKGGDGYQFDLVNDPASAGYQSIFNYLQGKVAGLQINMAGSEPTMMWRGGSPQVYLDEVLSDASMISSIPVSDIAYVKVFRPPFFGGSGGGNGAIAIYTRRGNDAAMAPSKGLSSNKVSGYSALKEFYSPNYDRFEPRNEQPDLRTTLYWNPSVIVSGKKPAVLSFYNNDLTKSFRVVIEGMSREGLLTHYEQIME